jgi:hypothetical protein
MRLPPDWDSESSSGWWPHLVHLIHKPCGLRTKMTYDLRGSEGPFGESDARLLVYSHTCNPDS